MLRTGWALDARNARNLGGECVPMPLLYEKRFVWHGMYCPETQKLPGHVGEPQKLSLLLSAKYIKWEMLGLQCRRFENRRLIPSEHIATP